MTGVDPTSQLDHEAASRYVLSRHVPSGGYSFYRTPEWGVEEPNAPDTLAALKSLRLLGTEIPEREATAGWLRDLQDDTGGFGTLTIGWAALLALAEIDAVPARSPAAWLEDRAQQLLTPRGPVRDWRGALRTALRVRQVATLAGAQTSDQDTARLLDAAKDTNGGWARPGADLETTAIAVLLAGDGARSRAVSLDAADLLRRCEDPILGFRITPDAGASSLGSLWGGVLIADRLGLDLRSRQRIAVALSLNQGPSGGFGPRDSALPSLHDTWLALETDRRLARLNVLQ